MSSLSRHYLPPEWESVLDAFRYRKSGLLTFPSLLSYRGFDVFRYSSDERIPRQLFRYFLALEEQLGAEWNVISFFRIAPRILFFAQIDVTGDLIGEACLQSIILPDSVSSEMSLSTEQIAMMNPSDFQYYRLDYQPCHGASPFNHLTPHLHYGHYQARSPFMQSKKGGLLLEFIEYLFNHFCHDSWLEWAEDTCREYQRISGRPVRSIADLERSFQLAVPVTGSSEWADLMVIRNILQKSLQSACALRTNIDMVRLFHAEL